MKKFICFRVVTPENRAMAGLEGGEKTSFHYCLDSRFTGNVTVEEANEKPYEIHFKKYYEPKRHD